MWVVFVLCDTVFYSVTRHRRGWHLLGSRAEFVVVLLHCTLVMTQKVLVKDVISD